MLTTVPMFVSVWQHRQRPLPVAQAVENCGVGTPRSVVQTTSESGLWRVCGCGTDKQLHVILLTSTEVDRFVNPIHIEAISCSLAFYKVFNTIIMSPPQMEQAAEDLPPMKDLTIANITDNVHAINSRCEDARMKFLFERLTTHLHDFARETRLSISEWEASIKFLVDVGKISTDVRHEFILLSDVLGLSLLVDSIDHPKPPNSTEGTVLGPFHTQDANQVDSCAAISHAPDGEPLLAVCSIKDTNGQPIPGVLVDVWETDSKGFYDVQYADRKTPDGRAILQSDENGMIVFKGIVPVPYPIPNDGPVGKLLGKLKRHPYRPSHMHFMFKKDGYDRLIT